MKERADGIRILEDEKPRKRFDGAYCSFLPLGWVNIGDIEYPLSYKIVTKEMKSLGLRSNPNIMTFYLGSWINLPNDDLEPGIGDWGGIWTKRTLGEAHALRHYCYSREKDPFGTRIFLSAINTPLFANDSRIKSKGVFLIEEIEKDFYLNLNPFEEPYDKKPFISR